ncbi:PREDICTED: uncharacterized protein LOC100634684 [Amphimedon queenslandica]|uniref:Uncharacterized protein n=1 Tax=Amphimedon queenslandica TaxID=400682 RepID=A0AAN0IDD6_AMPQE|nr:PREDICTED: uncharacterized protein LOC100634684 [Amphimedon queenslandica]|eukprot:XP_003385853.1 PREDICTED: uncharacterized protein LOC100634684 [Amphimedon queenslandica]
MPIGKISSTAGKGADYSAGAQGIQHATGQSGGKAEAGYQKSSATHSYGAGAVNEEAKLQTPKVKENLGYAKSELAGQSNYGAGAVGVELATNAPKIKHEGLGQVDKKQEMVHDKKGSVDMGDDDQ